MIQFSKYNFYWRTTMWLVVILTLLLAAISQPAYAAPGSETLTTGGAATLDSDTDGDKDPTEVDLGGTAQWRLNYENTSGAMLTNAKINSHLSSGQTYMPGSAQTPPGWTVEFSTDGGSSYVTQEPASGVTDLRFGASLVPPKAEGQVTSLLQPLLPVSQGTGGDGWIPIVAGNRIYAIFHHMGPNVPVLSCIDRTTNQVCPGYPKIIGPYYTSNTPGGGVFFNNRIYFRVQSPTQFGLMCWDSTTNASCGFTPLANLPGNTPTQHDRGTGPRAIGQRIFMVTDDHRVHCFDVATQALCPGYPVNSQLIQANVAPFQTGASSGFMDMEVDGTRIYASIGGYAGGINGAYLHCFDTATAAPCADWTAPVHENDPRYYGLFFRKDSSGVRNGICLMGEAGAPICYDLTGANRVSFSQMGNFPCLGGCFYSMQGDTEAGTKIIFGGNLASQVQCWDWSINGPCQGSGYVNGIVPNQTYNYGAVYDGTCVITLGDAGLLKTFDPATGNSPCAVTGAAATTTVAQTSFYCDGATHPATWDKARVIDVNLTPNVEFRSFVITVVDENNNVVAGPTDMVGTNGILDLSGVDASKTKLTAKVSANAMTNGSSYPAWSDGVPPKIALTFNSDPIQACFKTKVVCNNTTPTAISTSSTTALSGATASAQLSVYTQVPACIDTDGDGTFDNADTDDDNDGVNDTTEITNGTNPLKADTDGDGVNDGTDAFPLDSKESVDTDSDGVGDHSDNCPNVANADQVDTDHDGQGDACDTDDDNDGVLDGNDSSPLLPPHVSIADTNVNMHGLTRFAAPVNLATNGANVSALDFTLAYDQSCLRFDATTDSNNDGLPDAISGLPAGFVTSIQHQAANGGLTVLISPPNNNPPLPTLSTGSVATLAFDVLPACVADGATKDVAFTFSTASFGDNQGHEINGATDNAAYHLRFNGKPTAISLSATTINENQPSGAEVGQLASTDVDNGAPINDSQTYSLVAGPGDTDNGSFTISADRLKTAASLNFETKSSYTIRVRSSDHFGGVFEQSFTISVNDLNESPTDIQLDHTHVAENATAGTLIGVLTTSDEDLVAGGIDEHHSYSLPAGQLDNAQFQIVDNQLQTVAVFDHETHNTYNIRIRTTDSANQFVEKVYTVVVDNVNDRPVANDDPANPPLIVVGKGSPVTLDVLANDTDQDVGDSLTVSQVDNPTTAHGATTINNNKVDYTAPQHYNGADSFAYTASDANPLGALSDNANVNLYVVANDTRGDCNSDGKINAADFAALVLEIFDTDSALSWWRIFEQGFNGSPRGCDANASENGRSGAQPSVQASDISCTVLVFFGTAACTGQDLNAVAATTTTTATLAVDTGLQAEAGATVNVPIRLSNAGNHVAAATFALAFKADQLSFDPTDNNGDGLPDAIHFTIPQSMVASVHYNIELSRIEVAVYGINLPMPLLADGALANITLQVKPDITVERAPLALELASLGDDAGQTVELTASGADVQITSSIEGTAFDHLLYLPVVTR